MIDNVKIYYKCGQSMCQISLAIEPSSHWKGRNKAKLVHKTQMILHRPTVWFICTHNYIQRMDSGYSKYWPIFTSYQTLKIINKQHMLTLTIPAANSFSWILSIFDIGLKRAITNQYSILFLSKKLNYKMLNSAYTLCSYNKQRYSCFIVYDTSIWSILWYLVNFADILTFSESLG